MLQTAWFKVEGKSHITMYFMSVTNHVSSKTFIECSGSFKMLDGVL